MEYNFPRSFELVVSPEVEGGYVDHPADRGGPTKYGVTIETLKRWRRADVTKDDVRDLDLNEARAIFHTWYWSAVQGAEWRTGVDLSMFDMAINHGRMRAIMILQSAVGVKDDGYIGPVTRKAVRERTGEAVINACFTVRRAFYDAIVDNDPTQAVFRLGWAARNKHITEVGLKWLDTEINTLGGEPVPAPTPAPAPEPRELTPDELLERVERWALEEIQSASVGLWKDPFYAQLAQAASFVGKIRKLP